jgi:hypothetical protein
LFYSEVPVVPVIADRTLGSPLHFLPPLFSLLPQQRCRWPLLSGRLRPSPAPAPLHASPGSSATASAPPRCPLPRAPRYSTAARAASSCLPSTAVLCTSPLSIAYLNSKQDCCDPLSPAHSLSSSFPGHNGAAAVELHCHCSGKPWTARPAPSQATLALQLHLDLVKLASPSITTLEHHIHLAVELPLAAVPGRRGDPPFRPS